MKQTQPALSNRSAKSIWLLKTGAALLLGLAISAGSLQGSNIGLKLVAEGFTSPTSLEPLPDGRLLIVDQIGVVRLIEKNGQLAEEPFLDVRDRLVELRDGFDERGLLGLALHPQFNENRKFYVHYSAPLREDGPEGWDHTGHISEFRVQENNRAKADPASERNLLRIDQPRFNHNGGHLIFGPDGYLYIGLGDGGAANDRAIPGESEGNGQDKTTLLGSILRIDVNHGDPYGIPKDNPFANREGRDEIYAFGLRNVWGMSFDRGGKHEFFAADVGQNLFEEVNIIVKGGNYGWNIREGFHCFDPDSPNRPPEDCPDVGADGEPLIAPIIEYKNLRGFPRDPEGLGICVVGGYIYRGKALPQLQGRYIFADWTANWVLPAGVMLVADRPESEGAWPVEALDLATHPDGKVGAYITALGQDNEDELYVMTNDSNGVVGETGKLYKLVPHQGE